MKLKKEITYEIKKSKFIGQYYEINDTQQVDLILKNLRKKHKKAAHFPYAYRIDNVVRKSDDKEPSNTAGTPIYNIIEKKQLNHCLIVIIRYFGGVKLGSGGLIRAYSKSANEVSKF